jgi:vanillate O-demethylase ferredoxin subunit
MTTATRLAISAVRAQALDVISVELRDPRGMPLPPFAAGAHLEVDIASPQHGERPLIRHYSLCNSPNERDRYVVAVARLATGRGGSIALHDLVHAGLTLDVRGPRNNFPLVADAGFYRFIAGGIGITPILSMIRWCEDHGKQWALLYCARSRIRAAFYEDLLPFGDKVRFHFDDERHGQVVDMAMELSRAHAGEHVYCCGPQPLMKAVERQSAGRAAGSVHFEWFGAGAGAGTDPSPDPNPDPVQSRRENPPQDTRAESFEVVLRSSGKRIRIPPDKSILDVLEENDIAVPYACREGVCRSCETRLCSGEAEHRDYVLTAAEQAANRSLMICVSRARSAVLELDL